VTGDEIVHGRAGAAKRHVHELDAGFGLKERSLAEILPTAGVPFSFWNR